MKEMKTYDGLMAISRGVGISSCEMVSALNKMADLFWRIPPQDEFIIAGLFEERATKTFNPIKRRELHHLADEVYSRARIKENHWRKYGVRLDQYLPSIYPSPRDTKEKQTD